MEILVRGLFVPRPHILSGEDFCQRVVRFLRVRMDEHDRDGHQAKALIREFREYFHSDLLKETYAGMFMEVFFSLFEVLPFTERDVIRGSLEDFVGRKLRLHFFQTDDECALPLRFPALHDVPFYQDPTTGKPFSAETFYSPPLVLDVEFTRRMLRYGGRFQCNFVQMRCSLISTLKTLATSVLPLHFDDFELTRHQIHLVYPTSDNKRRLYFVLLALYALLRNKMEMSPQSQNSIRSLKLVFRSIKEPFVTTSEIGRFLNLILTGGEKGRKIEEFQNEFSREFPRGVDALTPRSLKQLCRCQARASLAKSGKLPHGVWTLDIPRELRHYLLLQRAEDEFHPKYVSALSTTRGSLVDGRF